MKHNEHDTSRNLLTNMPSFVFFICCFVYQLLFTFQGLDLSDGGFNGVFYQQVFDNPKSVEYNFMFWLTGVAGGGFYKLFPFLGLWGFRLLGVITNTITIVLAYRLLKKHISKSHTMIGLSIVLLTLNNEIKEFNYNMLSSLVNLIVISLLYWSTMKKQTIGMFLAGLLCGVNIFVRIPNVLTLGFFVPVAFYQVISNRSITEILRSATAFIAGYIAGFLLFVLVLQQIGHWDYFKYALNIVFNLADDPLPTDEGTTSSYGAITLIRQCILQTMQSVSYVVFLLLFFVFVYILSHLNFHTNRILKTAGRILALITFGLIFIVLFKGLVSYRPLLFLYTGFGLLLSLYWLLQNQNKEAQLLSALGLFLLLYYPFGSSFGLVTAGRYSFWIALPLAISIFLQMKGVNATIASHINKSVRTIQFTLISKHLLVVQRSFLLIAVVSGLYFSYYYPFFDWRDRSKMTYGLDNPQLKWIYTTQGRAAAVNELISAASKHTHPGDLLLAYDDIPMVNFATFTVPYMNNSMPWLYPAPLFEKELKASQKYQKKLPVIVKQKIKTFGDGSEWPEKLLPQPYEEWDVNRERNRVMTEFIKENNYKIVWSNAYFEILIP